MHFAYQDSVKFGLRMSASNAFQIFGQADIMTFVNDAPSLPNSGLSFGGHLLPLSDNAYTLGNGSYRMSEVFSVNGTINTSDERSKRDIEECNLGLDFVRKLKPVKYKWIENSHNRTHIGYVAQQVAEILGDEKNNYSLYIDGNVQKQKDILKMKEEDEDFDEEEYYKNSNQNLLGLRYTEFIPCNTKAIQDLSDIVSKQQKQIDDLKTLVSTLIKKK